MNCLGYLRLGFYTNMWILTNVIVIGIGIVIVIVISISISGKIFVVV